MTFQEQCMKTVFPRFIEGINAANRRARDLEARIEHLHNRVDAVAASLERLNRLFGKEVQEVNGEAGDLRVQVNDLLDRVNALEAKAAEKKTRKPRAKKAQDPVQMVEQAAQEAQAPVVETVEQAMNELSF